MSTQIKGQIEDFVPFFKGLVNDEGKLVFNEKGELSFTVDTGFSGGIALPEKVLEKMNPELIDFAVFRLATGAEVELPVFWGKVVMKNKEIETWFIPGDALLGVEFLSLAGSLLTVNFKKEKIILRD